MQFESNKILNPLLVTKGNKISTMRIKKKLGSFKIGFLSLYTWVNFPQILIPLTINDNNV